MLIRVLVGVFLGAIISAAARHLRALSTSGAIAATLIGSCAVAAGWAWGVTLIAYFVAAAALSRWRSHVKEARTSDTVAKGGPRDARQVVANGGVFAIAMIALATGADTDALAALALGALAASAADSWATEIGVLSRRPPRSILSFRVVPPGTSGGVTGLGLVASIGGAAFMALIALGLHQPPSLAAVVFVAGVAGSIADSLFGATLQVRRTCDVCGTATERRVHSCGNGTRQAGGVPGFDNDVVNFAATVVGGLLALLLAG